MSLIPMRPPGRITRKARSFAAEIWQLREQGYTFEAIREALAGAGIQVSNTTVQREVARYAKRKTSAAPAPTEATNVTPQSLPRAPIQAGPSIEVPGPSVCPEPVNGKDIAEAFMRNRITNPLLRNRSTDEDRRH